MDELRKWQMGMSDEEIERRLREMERERLELLQRKQERLASKTPVIEILDDSDSDSGSDPGSGSGSGKRRGDRDGARPGFSSCEDEIRVFDMGYIYDCGLYSGLYAPQIGLTCATHAVNAMVYSVHMLGRGIDNAQVTKMTKRLFAQVTRRRFDRNYEYDTDVIWRVLEMYGLECRLVSVEDIAVPGTPIVTLDDTCDLIMKELNPADNPADGTRFQRLRGYIITQNGHHFALRRSRNKNSPAGHCWYNLDSLASRQSERCARSPIAPAKIRAYLRDLFASASHSGHFKVMEVCIRAAFPYITPNVWGLH